MQKYARLNINTILVGKTGNVLLQVGDLWQPGVRRTSCK